ncbi:MAG: hypothetical protein ABFS46_22080 [Myxococcota bacterium]
MRRRRFLWAPLLWQLLLTPHAGAESVVPSQTWFVQRVSTGEAPLRVEYLWSKGGRLRAETVVAGRPILTLVAGEFYYVIDTLAGKGVAIRRHARAISAEAAGERPFANEGRSMLAEGAERIGSGSQPGRPCDVYRLTNRRGRREICLTRDEFQLPVRSTEFDRASGRSVETRYLDWARGFPAPDVFFEPDPRVELERVEYDAYLDRSRRDTVGPAPVLYRVLLHGP